MVPIDAELQADTLHNFSFQLTNPDDYRGPARGLTMASSDFFFATPMAGGEANAAPLQVLGFTSSSIGQSSASAGAVNTVTITFRSSGDLDAELLGRRTLIVISGLQGSQTKDSANLALARLSDSARAAFGSTAVWKQAAGALILRLVANLEGRVDVVLSVDLVNPQTPQDSPRVTIQASQGLVIRPIRVAQADGLARPLLVAGFSRALVIQSTPSQGADNLLTVSLACNFPLLNNETTIITIDGLVGSDTAGGVYLALSGPNASMFGDGTGWNTHKAYWRHARQIEFRAEAEAAANQAFSVAFVLKNPSSGQASPELSVRASGLTFSTAWQPVDKGAGNLAPLLVASWSFLSIGQSNARPSDLNTLTVTVASSCELGGPGQQVFLHIEGLDNASWPQAAPVSDKANNLVTLTTGAAYTSLSATNATNSTNARVAKKLTLRIASNASSLPAGRLYAFRLNVTNPAQVQPPPRVLLSLTGDISIGPTAAHTPEGIGAALRVFSFASVTGMGFVCACLMSVAFAHDCTRLCTRAAS